MQFNSLCSPEEAAIRWLVYLDSPEFDEKDKEEFLKWLNKSAANQAAYVEAERLSLTGATLAARAKEEPDTHFFAAWQGALAMCCLVAVIGWFAAFKTPSPSLDVFELQTSIGEQLKHTLKDGSTISLNTNTHMRVETAQDKVTTYLQRGEALFNVAPNENRAFDVVTSSGIVRVLGTQFSVQQTMHDTLVTVIKGRVALAADLKTSQTFVPNTVITANQQLTLRAAKSGQAPISLDAKTALAWTQKRLIYRGETLRNVVADLNRYYVQEIMIGDSALNEKKVLATLKINKNVEATTAKLALALGISAELDKVKNTITLKVKKQ